MKLLREILAAPFYIASALFIGIGICVGFVSSWIEGKPIKVTRKSIPCGLQKISLKELVQKIKNYEFTDAQCHPLHNCDEFIELVNRAKQQETNNV